ncbi:hypothetical protein ANN_19167 [Periplaneta americana]|uniref:Uncharacterized protein n=1 Tax=Periplaneta americana TaxID=6978 RepID=A0ABQ8S9N9_PERAM|nr:hypothetical protein ANN_19167 [Periplaneta americana]
MCQILQEFRRHYRPKRESFAIDILHRIANDGNFLLRMFSSKATFHLSGKVSVHNMRILGSENLHVFQEHFNLSLLGYYYTTYAIRALQGRDLSGEELIYGSHTYFFDHTRTWRASPDEGSAQCQGYLRYNTNI